MIISTEQAITLLTQGKVVAVPTETVYGLAADALNPEAIAAVFEIKNRPADNPLICHFSSKQQVKEFVKEIPDNAEKLMHHLSPGPVSFMLNLPDESPLRFATCGSSQVIVRIPDHPMLLDIISQMNRPLAAPSANTSGKISPTTVAMVESDLGARVAGIVDGGECRVGIESTILDARSANEVVLLRHGSIGEKEIHGVLPDVAVRDVKAGEQGVTPGTRYRHYSPDTQIFLIDRFETARHERNIALLLTKEQWAAIADSAREKFLNHANHFVLMGSVNNLPELARKFYFNLSALDRLNVSKAFFLNSDFGTSSLGKALHTRVRKITSV